MATNKHPKREMANRMLTPKERADGISPFNSKAWSARHFAIELRVKKNLELVAARKAVRERKRTRRLFSRV